MRRSEAKARTEQASSTTQTPAWSPSSMRNQAPVISTSRAPARSGSTASFREMAPRTLVSSGQVTTIRFAMKSISMTKVIRLASTLTEALMLISTWVTTPRSQTVELPRTNSRATRATTSLTTIATCVPRTSHRRLPCPNCNRSTRRKERIGSTSNSFCLRRVQVRACILKIRTVPQLKALIALTHLPSPMNGSE